MKRNSRGIGGTGRPGGCNMQKKAAHTSAFARYVTGNTNQATAACMPRLRNRATTKTTMIVRTISKRKGR